VAEECRWIEDPAFVDGEAIFQKHGIRKQPRNTAIAVPERMDEDEAVMCQSNSEGIMPGFGRLIAEGDEGIKMFLQVRSVRRPMSRARYPDAACTETAGFWIAFTSLVLRT
jgi:hypothetical protein